MSSIEKTKKNILSGSNLTEEIFKLGFMACIESVQDKGHNNLSLKLIDEHSKL